MICMIWLGIRTVGCGNVLHKLQQRKWHQALNPLDAQISISPPQPVLKIAITTLVQGISWRLITGQG